VTGKELREIRKTLGLTQVELAAEIGVSGNTVARWERDEVSISQPVSRLLRILVGTRTRQTGKARADKPKGR
jgi:DNA-binding transcriptional regulator YiaG